MKQMPTIQKSRMKHLLPYIAILFSIMAMPFSGYSQSGPPPPTGGNGNGSLPDSPLGVPFDWRLNVLLLLAGVVFAVVILKKKRKVSNVVNS
jgi:hypothetical protein